MSTEYGRFTDEAGNEVSIEASRIGQSIRIENNQGVLYFRLNERNADTLVRGLSLCYVHNGWDWPL